MLSPSASLFGSLGSVGAGLTSTKITDGTNQYQVDAGQKLLASAAVSSLYPGTAQTVSAATVNRLVTSAPASQFVRDPGAPTVYLVDGGTRHAVSSEGQLNAWSVGSVPSINLVNGSSINLLPSGSALSSYIADSGTQRYLMSGQLLPVPAALNSSYTASSGGTFSASSALLSLFPAGPNATGFIKSASSPDVYLIDNGLKRHIPSITDFVLWDGTRNEAVTTLPSYVLNQFSGGSDVKSFVTDGTYNYQFDNGSYYTVDSTQQTNWGLSNPVQVAAGTVTRFTNGGALTGSAKVGPNYYLVRNGSAFPTVDSNIAAIWQIGSAQAQSQTLLSLVPTPAPLQRYARSTAGSDNRIFLRDGGTIYQLASPAQVYNFGFFGGSAIPQLTPTELTALTSGGMAQNILVSNSYSGVVDNGGFRSFADNATAQLWKTSSPSNFINVSDSLVSTLLPSGSATRVIKGGGPNVYTIQGGQKRYISSPSRLQQDFGSYPVTGISDLLLGQIPSGPDY